MSVKSACPYLTRLPNGSSATVEISGGVHRVRSMSMLSAAGTLRPVIKAAEDHVVASKMTQERFKSHLCITGLPRAFSSEVYSDLPEKMRQIKANARWRDR